MAMNLTILLALGRFTADRYGPGVVLPVFLLTAIAGGAVFGLLTGDRLPMVGASGAVFGFLGVWIAWDWRRHRAAGASTGPVVRRVLVLVFLNVVLWFALSGGLAWQAHLGGFLAGLACGAWFESRDRPRRARAPTRPPAPRAQTRRASKSLPATRIRRALLRARRSRGGQHATDRPWPPARRHGCSPPAAASPRR